MTFLYSSFFICTASVHFFERLFLFLYYTILSDVSRTTVLVSSLFIATSCIRSKSKNHSLTEAIVQNPGHFIYKEIRTGQKCVFSVLLPAFPYFPLLENRFRSQYCLWLTLIFLSSRTAGARISFSHT